MKKKEWTKMGVVAVDSGQLIICDPCRIDSEWKNEEYTNGTKPANNFSYNACCNKKGDGEQLNFKKGSPGIGVVFSSGLGDGIYEVLSKRKTYKDYGERICEVKIILIKD